MTATDALAAVLLQACDVDPRPPVNLERLARRLGVDEIVIVRGLLEDGRLEYSPDRTRILLKAGVNRTRQRFTLAHELGHLVCHDSETPLVARRMISVGDDEERFCDGFAAAVLLPREPVDRLQRGRPRDLETLRRVAQTCDTSLAAACVRLREISGWRHSLLRWRHDAGSWRFVAGAGIPGRLWGRIRSAEGTSAILDATARETADVTVDVPIRIGDTNARVQGIVSVRGRTAVALVDLNTI